ncbi:MAG: DUF2889 domain-containing protein [Syntrophomonadaceae bacterium]|nr:DUF2889 domain-containing protein [Syntrophomonadaceae bacterium]
MNLLVNRFWHTDVTREDESTVAARVFYADPFERLKAVLIVDIYSLLIQGAYLYRMGLPPNMEEKSETIEQLKGIIAHLGSGGALKNALQNVKGEVAKFLFSEAVTGVIQAETFFYRERGYSSLKSYCDQWLVMNKDACRYYSNLDHVYDRWDEYIGKAPRQVNLYERYKSQQLYKYESGSYGVFGTMMDSFHHVSDSLEMDEGFRILKAEGSIIQGPYRICYETGAYMSNLAGNVLTKIDKKRITELLGGKQGCTHLIGLVFDNVQTVKIHLDKTN